MEFKHLKQAVSKQFALMQTYPLFSTKTDKDALWQLYLAAFPAGTNPIYRTRTTHDCGCCKQFIRNIGGVVALIDGKTVSLWDMLVEDPDYQTVAAALAAFVHKHEIEAPYLHYEKTVGTDKNFEQLVDGQHCWEHFHVHLPAVVVKPKDKIPSLVGEYRTTYEVAERGLREITPNAVSTVLELIAENSLYRGEEHKGVVVAFKNLQTQYRKAEDKDTFVWTACLTENINILRARNSVIGTLLVDLSDGVDLEQAVKAFEVKVAPTNYKRPTALVTQAMIDAAKAKIEEVGLTNSLSRRYASLADITINNVLFADREVKPTIGGSIFDDIAPTAAAKELSKVEDITIDKFIADVLPNINSIEALVENRHQNNLVSLVTAVDPTAPLLFKWDNPFSWSYNGEVADSIKERVKAAGGNVDGDLCCRLAWYNRDDLDFHMKEPDGTHIYFGVRRSKTGGTLDVDANGGDGIRENPVENIFYADKSKMKPGTYKLAVNQYNRRETTNIGFEVEIEALGMKYNMVYPKAVQGTIDVAEIMFDGVNFKVECLLENTQSSKQIWGIDTMQFTPVSVLMNSPNHWDGQSVGNRHVFFMLRDCNNEESARGFYNEFLRSDLEDHRKVLELVGSRMRLDESATKLNGLGFSSTQRNNLVCRVKGNYTRVLNITF